MILILQDKLDFIIASHNDRTHTTTIHYTKVMFIPSSFASFRFEMAKRIAKLSNENQINFFVS